MKKIKFSRGNTYFVQELRARVKDYFEQNNISSYGNTNLIIKSVVMLLLFLAPYILMLTGTVQAIPLLLLCWMAMGLGVAGVGMVLMHDANHGSFSANQRINRWLGKSLYLLGGYPANWRFQHNTLHHGFTNIEGHDEDISPPGFLRFSPHRPLHRIHRYQHWYAWFFYSLMTLSWVTTKDFSGLAKYKKMNAPLSNKNRYGLLLLDLVFAKILYFGLFLVLPILLVPVPWYWIILGFVLMHMVSGLVLGVIFQTAHVVPSSQFPLPDEQGHLENNWAIHQLLTTADFSPKSRWFSWLIGGLNYQVIHHLFPNISHVHYHKLSPIVAQTTKEFNLPYHVQPSFFTAVRNHARMLKLLGKH